LDLTWRPGSLGLASVFALLVALACFCYIILQMEKFLDSDLEAFVKNNIKTFLAWDLLVYFYRNPSEVETAYALASKLGRNINDVEKTCADLANKGLLIKNPYGYCLTQNEALKKQVKRFGEAIESREKRLLLLTYLLKQDYE